jgi:hypothetical protein
MNDFAAKDNDLIRAMKQASKFNTSREFREFRGHLT